MAVPRSDARLVQRMQEDVPPKFCNPCPTKLSSTIKYQATTAALGRSFRVEDEACRAYGKMFVNRIIELKFKIPTAQSPQQVPHVTDVLPLSQDPGLLRNRTGTSFANALARSPYFPIQFHHFHDGLLAPAAHVIERAVVLFGQAVQHAEHIVSLGSRFKEHTRDAVRHCGDHDNSPCKNDYNRLNSSYSMQVDKYLRMLVGEASTSPEYLKLHDINPKKLFCPA
ncbi:hypothetical protein DV515_00004298 [Chloebia gouldiae]|uniref:Uncharacterized protein n=1 Tax=Chloebia gouldiae TaxID=44316 RepID=A0A3L8SR78_CHLGU|nr:hypothetical protein DV515_00004298 [Chloebia gouldiae]